MTFVAIYIEIIILRGLCSKYLKIIFTRTIRHAHDVHEHVCCHMNVTLADQERTTDKQV